MSLDTEANPFRYGALALDDAFTNREREIAELKADIVNGQDVVVFAPRRYGKSSLMWRVAEELTRRRVLVASVDLMTTPTVAKLAEKLARAIHEDVASRREKALDRLRIFSSLRVKPTVNVDPDTGKLSFGFDAGYAPEDLRATLEHLLALPGEIGVERKRRVALIFDEFQEVVDIDPTLPRLMRAVFQEQPEVAHVYLGSKRHMMRRLFSDENEPFWRCA
jgi:AAA+ ATPase superfamily predicted ATPase